MEKKLRELGRIARLATVDLVEVRSTTTDLLQFLAKESGLGDLLFPDWEEHTSKYRPAFEDIILERLETLD